MFEPDDEVLVAAFDKAVSSYRQMFKRGRSVPEVPGNTSQDVSGRGGSARKARPAREEEREGEKKRRRQSVAVMEQREDGASRAEWTAVEDSSTIPVVVAKIVETPVAPRETITAQEQQQQQQQQQTDGHIYPPPAPPEMQALLHSWYWAGYQAAWHVLQKREGN